MKPRRFRIALSFAGEKRPFVGEVAGLLAAQFDESRILYDKFHEAEFAHADLAYALPALYKTQSDLNVVILSPNYAEREWCGLEWRALFSQIKEGDAKQILLCRFDRADIHGLFDLAGFIELDELAPADLVTRILQRLALNEGHARDHYLAPSRGSGDIPQAEHNHPEIALPVVRRPSPLFLGRAGAIETIHTHFAGNDAPPLALEGIFGVGKTELALQYIHRHATATTYPGGIYWFTATNDIPTQWLTAAAHLGIATEGRDTNAILQQIFREFRSKPRALFVFDDASTPSVARGEWYRPHHRILITTRIRDLGGIGFSHLHVTLLDEGSASELLTQLMGSRAASCPDDVDPLVRAFAGHTLALEVAGAYLRRRPFVSVDHFLQSIQTAPVNTGHALEDVGYGRSVDDVLGAIVRDLGVDSPPVRLMKLVAMFGDARIPTRILKSAWDALHQVDFNGQLGELFDLHLIDHTHADSLSMHPVIAAYTARLARGAADAVDLRSARTAALVQDLFGLDNFDFSGFAELDPHISKIASEHDCRTRERAVAIGNAALFLQRLGRHADSRRWLEEAISIEREIEGEGGVATATLKSNLAMLLMEADELELAEQYAREALTVDQQQLGVDHIGTALDHSNLSLILAKANRFPEALTEMRLSLRAYELHLPADNPLLAQVRANYAGILLDLGRTVPARKQLDLALEAHLGRFGSNDPYVALDRAIQARLLLSEGRPADALLEADEALRITRHVFGDTHRDVARRRELKARALEVLGQFADAEIELRLACEIERRLLGDRHASVIARHTDLAMNLRAQSKYQAALREIDSAIAAGVETADV